MAVLTPVSGELIDRLASQPNHRAMVTFLRRHRALWDPDVVERLYERVVRVARIDLRQADRLADATAWLAAQLADDACRAQSLRATGHVLLIRGKYREAIAQYEAALKLFRALGREVDVGRTLSGGALQSRILLGQYDDAFASGEEARLIFERHGERLHLARLDSNMGNILYRQDRFQEALPLYERSYAQLARIGQPPDVAAVLSNLAVCYTAVNDFGRSLAAYHDAREYCEANGLPLLVAQADYNIAYLHYLRGEYTRALELYRAAEEQSERVGDAYHQALCDLDRSEIYLELNMSGEAGALASRALAIFDDLGMAYEAAKAMTNLAIALSHGRQTAPALELFDRARALFTGEGNQAMLALVDFYRALVLYRDGRYREARPLCRRALRLFAGAAMPGKAVRCELLLARLELDAGDFAAAEQIARSALRRADDAQSPILRYQAYVVLGSIREAGGDPHAAYEAFERARADLEYLRGHLRVEDLKVAFLKDKVGVYEGLVSTCLAIGTTAERQERAFGFIEEAKSRGLADLIFFRGSALGPRVESDLGDEVRDLREQVDRAYRHIELEEVRPGTLPPRRFDTLRQRARVLEGRLDTALTALRAADQEFAAIEGGVAFALDEIRSALTPGTTLVEYYEARGLIYACVLDGERLAVVPVASAAAVRDLHGLLQFQVSKFRLGARYTEAFADRLRAPTEAHLRELYDALVAPIRDRLRGDHLVIVPHGFLHYVPFHALFDGARFLIDQFTVSYAPSASVYRLCCMDREPPRGDPLVMGVTDARTPYIVDEIEAVAKALPGARVFMGEEATADRLRSGGSASPLVHIATHGIFRGDNPMFSSIRLGDGLLRVFDLYHLRLAADLVALSGCSTGLNAVVGADELLGLVRGLLYAGARALLLTLWDVHDLSTANFMRAFYGHLQSGRNKAEALQMAMQEVRARYPHPFYWAPFVLIGHVQQK